MAKQTIVSELADSALALRGNVLHEDFLPATIPVSPRFVSREEEPSFVGVQSRPLVTEEDVEMTFLGFDGEDPPCMCCCCTGECREEGWYSLGATEQIEEHRLLNEVTAYPRSLYMDPSQYDRDQAAIDAYLKAQEMGTLEGRSSLEDFGYVGPDIVLPEYESFNREVDRQMGQTLSELGYRV